MNPFMLFLWAARALPQEESVGESSVNNSKTRRFGFFLALGKFLWAAELEGRILRITNEIFSMKRHSVNFTFTGFQSQSHRHPHTNPSFEQTFDPKLSI